MNNSGGRVEYQDFANTTSRGDWVAWFYNVGPQQNNHA